MNSMPAGSFLASSVTHESLFGDLDQFQKWLAARRQANMFKVQTIPFEELDQWHFAEKTGNLGHKSGRFFTVEGLRLSPSVQLELNEQPIINQPEIGILGIITKVFDGTRYFLMQAKMEPGNVNVIQLSPTVQATKSNYTQVHRGKRPLYVDYFLDRGKSTCYADSLQTEQGARFYRKRNRNIIVGVEDDIDLHEDFYWLTLNQIKSLLACDNIVNMDSRSVLACVPFTGPGGGLLEERIPERQAEAYEIGPGIGKELFFSLAKSDRSAHSIQEILSWFTEIKALNEFTTQLVPLSFLKDWKRTATAIEHRFKKTFSVIAVKVQAGNREVVSWTQPLLKDERPGLIGFMMKKINGILHLLVQARLECGNFDIVDMAPTVSCARCEDLKAPEEKPPFLDFFLEADGQHTVYSALQSEEGGRFYRIMNRNMIIYVDEETVLDLPHNYIWMTYGQILDLMKYGYFNIESRSVLSAISFR